MRRRLLFALAGTGAGNLTRTLAILEALPADRFEIRFVAQGRSRALAPAGWNMVPLEDATFGTGPFTAWSVLAHNLTFPARLRRNQRRCASVLDAFAPDLVVVDSDLFCLAPARGRRIPIVSVNSSAATVALLGHRAGRGAGFAAALERVDRALQRRYASLVICPVVSPVQLDDPRDAAVRQIPPIVRRQFRDAAERRGSCEYDVAVMLGRTGMGAAGIDLSGIEGSMIVVGHEAGGRFPASAERVPFTLEPARYLARSRVIVVQGGFNSLSEVLALRKPAVIVPVPRHAEQIVNATTAERLGFAVVASAATLGDAVKAQLARWPAGSVGTLALPTCDGAERAARLIASAADGLAPADRTATSPD